MGAVEGHDLKCEVLRTVYLVSPAAAMRKSWFTFIFTFIVFRLVSSTKPSFVIFLVDDLGIADVGCFGNDTIKTPNIDRLAEQGARLRHDVTPDSICTPNRAAFLTGRYPIRSGLGGQNIRAFIFSSTCGGLPQNETTFAEIASAAGYATGRYWPSRNGAKGESTP